MNINLRVTLYRTSSSEKKRVIVLIQKKKKGGDCTNCAKQLHKFNNLSKERFFFFCLKR